MKTPIAIMMVYLGTAFGAFAGSGDKNKTHFTHTQENPSNVCKEVKKSIKTIGEEFKFIENNYFFDQHFKDNTNLRKTGIYLFKNFRNVDQKKSKEQRV